MTQSVEMSRRAAANQAVALLNRASAQWVPPAKMGVAAWSEANRILSDKTPFPGPFRLWITPFLREPLEALNDPTVVEVDAQKSAQIGWTDGVLMNWLGSIIDEDPAPTLVLFPADKKGREFNAEKFMPAVEQTPCLAEKLVTKSRALENRQDFKLFPGGFVKFVGSNSPANVKSTTAKNVAVEEPDDCNLNVKGQGDAISMAVERKKRYPGGKMLVGGTPSIVGVSAIVQRMELTDKRRYLVPCHHCNEAAELRWENVRWSKETGRGHPVYGDERPETARYVCPSCGGEWADAERIANIRRADALKRAGKPGVGWQPTAEFNGRRGFYFSELMSVFPGSELAALAAGYLVAKHEMDTEGDITKMIVFWNQTLGLPWEYKGKTADPEALAQRLEDYPEWYVPWGGVILTAGVDVQHDRLAVVVRAWGEGEESWLVWAGELYGNVLEDAVWDELDRTVIFRTYKHVAGAAMHISAASVDSSDGQTSDAVYRYCRRANRKFGVARAMPIKGARSPDAELFRKPGSPLEVDAQHKAARYGTRPYMVGVGRAKDLILGADEQAGRINLRDSDASTGRGPGRLHWYRGVRADYFEQLTAEVKAPARDAKGSGKLKKVWQRKAGKRNEFLDCEVYALHAARALRLDTYTQQMWKATATRLLQGNLFASATAETPVPADTVETERAHGLENPGESVNAEAASDTAAAAAPGAVHGPGLPVPVQMSTPIARAPQPPRGGGRRVRSTGVQL